MGNQNKRQKLITQTSHNKVENNPEKRGEQNHVAREILNTYVKSGVPSEPEILTALAIQQSVQNGPLKKLDYIAILTRLNPNRNNALISQYKVQDLIDLIRYELYSKVLETNSRVEIKPQIEVIEEDEQTLDVFVSK